MAYGGSNGHLTDNVTWPREVVATNTVAASLQRQHATLCFTDFFLFLDTDYLISGGRVLRPKWISQI